MSGAAALPTKGGAGVDAMGPASASVSPAFASPASTAVDDGPSSPVSSAGPPPPLDASSPFGSPSSTVVIPAVSTCPPGLGSSTSELIADKGDDTIDSDSSAPGFGCGSSSAVKASGGAGGGAGDGSVESAMTGSRALLLDGGGGGERRIRFGGGSATSISSVDQRCCRGRTQKPKIANQKWGRSYSTTRRNSESTVMKCITSAGKEPKGK